VRLRIPSEALEAVAHLLHEHGTGGVVIDDETAAQVRAYLPCDERLAERLSALRAALADLVAYFPGMAELALEQSVVHDEDWANSWRAYYHPVHVAEGLVVAPTWSKYQASPGETVVWLDPGMAFGTGTHPSTVLCLRALAGLIRPGVSVLDLGTGSGVLAIAAALLGADRVVAVDVDPLAVRIARENVAQNGVADRVTVRHGELPQLLASGWQPVDVAVANLTADWLTELAGALAAALKGGGILVGSGVVASSHARVEAAFAAAGMSLWRTVREEDWVAVWARRRT
jgi:ribosomal protein L11 methyltransferase